MKTIDFKEAKFTLIGDHLVDHYGQPVFNIKAYRDNNEIITKWQMTWHERLSALLFGVVWLRVLSNTTPPVALSVKRDIFK